MVDDAWRAFAEPHRRDITIDGRTLHCIDAGSGEAVLLAGYRDAARRPDSFASLAGLARDFFSTGFDRLCSNLETVTTPSLVVWGEQDPWLPFRRGRALAARLPHARLVAVRRCGHLPHVEHPEVVNLELSAFFGPVIASRG